MRFEELRGRSLADLAGCSEQNFIVALDVAILAAELERIDRELIRAIACACLAVIDHRIAEAAGVATRFPNLRVHEECAVETPHAVTLGRPRRYCCLVVVRDHVVPP